MHLVSHHSMPDLLQPSQQMAKAVGWHRSTWSIHWMMATFGVPATMNSGTICDENTSCQGNKPQGGAKSQKITYKTVLWRAPCHEPSLDGLIIRPAWCLLSARVHDLARAGNKYGINLQLWLWTVFNVASHITTCTCQLWEWDGDLVIQ